MLARAAERVYWTGRYLERAENTARIVQQYSQLLLDLPEEVGVGWSELVTIFGAAGVFPADADMTDEKRVLRFLVSDAGSPSSLAHAIRMARDNIRNTRDLLPQESWECVNELDHFARRRLPDTADDEDRFELLDRDAEGRLRVRAHDSSTRLRRTPPASWVVIASPGRTSWGCFKILPAASRVTL